MIIHVEKTFRAITGQTCETDFKKKMKIIKHFFFLFLGKIRNFLYLFPNQKVYLIVSFTSSLTYSVKNWRSTALLIVLKTCTQFIHIWYKFERNYILGTILKTKHKWNFGYIQNL